MRILKLAAAAAIALVCAGAANAQCDVPQGAEAIRADAVEHLNAYRRQAGLPPVRASAALSQAAQDHACNMLRRGFFDHVGPDGADLGDRIRRHGYRPCYASENIAWGQRSVPEVTRGWMNSSSHRRNMLNRRAREVGIAIGTLPDGRRPHWVMVLGEAC